MEWRLYLIALTFFSVGGSWLWHSPALENWKDSLVQYIDNRDILTLEIRFQPDRILKLHRNELLENDKRKVQNVALKYYPYLLLEVKYPDHSNTREGFLLWGMNNGEMVLNTETWETTHGFADCLDCHAARSDFKILYALARRQGIASLEELRKEFQIERELLNTWIEEAKSKHLILQKGHYVQLHFENPKLLVNPQTKINRYLTSKPRGEGEKVSRTYSRTQILDLTQIAFGSEFKTRSETEVFLPVYSFEILNPDGSVYVSEWNALTGQQIIPRYLSSR